MESCYTNPFYRICKDKEDVVAEYTLADIHKPLGVSAYDLRNILPEEFKSSLPTIEEIERNMKD
nr:PDDEXK nuclease domain-containing protein [Parabacteroides goldsteinii]